MNNRLRLRFWDKEECQYLKPSFFDSIWFDKDGGIHIGCYSDIVGKVVDYTNEIDIEQCTGLSDKNGKLIYENDIIIAPNNSHKLIVIRMKNGVYGCKEYRFNGMWEMNLYDLIKHYGVEIIGNIHE